MPLRRAIVSTLSRATPGLYLPLDDILRDIDAAILRHCRDAAITRRRCACSVAQPAIAVIVYADIDYAAYANGTPFQSHAE